jgi:hypothetical protein|tara:strand:+ start:398 stop:532 length:135 start_codon:yes stop_codon:yes gene_type:complete
LVLQAHLEQNNQVVEVVLEKLEQPTLEVVEEVLQVALQRVVQEL